jgi:hypothetical protein
VLTVLPYLERPAVNAFFRDYLRGYGFGVADKIQAMRAVTLREAIATQTALVLALDSARIQAVFAREFPSTRQTRPERRRDPAALAAGRWTGYQVGLGHDHLTHDHLQPSQN